MSIFDPLKKIRESRAMRTVAFESSLGVTNRHARTAKALNSADTRRRIGSQDGNARHAKSPIA